MRMTAAPIILVPGFWLGGWAWGEVAGLLRADGHDVTALTLPGLDQSYAKEHPDWAFLAGIPELRDITWVDLPTSHWPMWSKPAELARIIGDIATKAGESAR